MNKVMPKKILYIHHGKGLGGAPLSLLYLVKSLDKSKYHPIVLFLHNSEVINLFKEHNIETAGPVNLYDFPHTAIWWFRWYHLPYLVRAIKDSFKTYFWAAPAWLDTIKPDLIHLNTSSLIAWAAIAHKKNIPVFWHIREPLALGHLGIRRWFIKHCVAKYATMIIPICKNDAKPWQNNPKVHVVYNAVDPKQFDPTISCNDFLIKHHLNAIAPRILFLGGLSQEKGTLLLLKIFEKLLTRLPQTQLLIAGYFDINKPTASLKKLFPAYRYQMKVTSYYLKLKNNIILLGPIKNVPEAMATSNVIAFPATQGHFARPIIEAGFMKKPVIASQLPPLDELVINGKTGFLVAPAELDGWVEALTLVLTDKKFAEQMGASAYTFCSQHFDLQQQITRLLNFYDIILAKKEITANATRTT